MPLQLEAFEKCAIQTSSFAGQQSHGHAINLSADSGLRGIAKPIYLSKRRATVDARILPTEPI